MNSGRFEPFVSYDEDRPSRLILFPFSTHENFCSEEWIGRESAWFSIFNVLHWALSYFNHDRSSRVLLLQPDSPDLERNLKLHLDEGQTSSIAVDGGVGIMDELRERLEAQWPESLDLILATGVFSSGASHREENQLLRACRRSLKDGCPLLATFPLEDQLGNPLTAQNIQFLDAAAAAGLKQDEIVACDGITRYLGPEFWNKLRKQGHVAFDTVLVSLSHINDSPETLWMSSAALYIGTKA